VQIAVKKLLTPKQNEERNMQI